MSLVWAVPVVMLLVGGAAIAALTRATAESARELAAEVARFGELHAALGRVRTELQHTSGSVRDLRGSRPRH